MKKILFYTVLLFFIFNNNCFSQSIGSSVGFSSKSYFLLDSYFATKKGLTFKINMSADLSRGLKGEDYTGTINWDAFPEDHITEGSFINTFDFGVGKSFNRFIILGLLGIAIETDYRNCFDKYHILGANGYYYKTIIGNKDLNYGIEVSYLMSRILFSMSYTKYSGIGAKIGFYLRF